MNARLTPSVVGPDPRAPSPLSRARRRPPTETVSRGAGGGPIGVLLAAALLISPTRAQPPRPPASLDPWMTPVPFKCVSRASLIAIDAIVGVDSYGCLGKITWDAVAVFNNAAANADSLENYLATIGSICPAIGPESFCVLAFPECDPAGIGQVLPNPSLLPDFSSLCPPPLITNPNATLLLLLLTNATQSSPQNNNYLFSCQTPCCVPCPAIYHIFDPNTIEHLVDRDIIPVMALSSLCALLVFLSYACLRTRANPQGLFVASLNLGIFLYLGVGPLMSAGDRAAAVCDHSDPAGVRVATFFDNYKCAVQSIFFLTGFNASTIFTAVIVLNIHLKLIWRKDFVERHHVLAQGFGWILAGLLTAIPIATGNVDGSNGLICSINFDNLQPMWAAQGILSFGAFFVHFGTVLYAFVVHRRSKSNHDERRHWIRGQVKLHWRASVLTTMFFLCWLCLFIVDFIYENSTAKSPDAPFFTLWAKCLDAHRLTGDGQAACSYILQDNLFNITTFTAVVNIALLQGFYSLLVFLSHRTIFAEWCLALSRFRRRLFGRRRGRRGRHPQAASAAGLTVPGELGCAGDEDDDGACSVGGTIVREGGVAFVIGPEGMFSHHLETFPVAKPANKLASVAPSVAVEKGKGADAEEKGTGVVVTFEETAVKDEAKVVEVEKPAEEGWRASEEGYGGGAWRPPINAGKAPVAGADDSSMEE
ncbi:hypothetical protein HK101_007900, partial [Irineochytrium annulatum]